MCSYCTQSYSRAQRDSHLLASVFCGLFAIRCEPTITTQGRPFIENYFLTKWASTVVRQYFFIHHYLRYSRFTFMSQTVSIWLTFTLENTKWTVLDNPNINLPLASLDFIVLTDLCCFWNFFCNEIKACLSWIWNDQSDSHLPVELRLQVSVQVVSSLFIHLGRSEHLSLYCLTYLRQITV